MGVRFGAAQAIGAVSSWGLKNVFRRPAGNFPGKIALYVDPKLIADLRPKLAKGSICVVGTNGKTTVTNMLANAIEAEGLSVVCNRTGANLDSGVATSLLESKGADWGVFECDELWLSRILPLLQAEYCVLLDLFPDQLDRVGEIDYIQNSIIKTLQRSPQSVLIYNADDPHCQRIADSVSNPKIPIGLTGRIGNDSDELAEAQMCQQCNSMLEYEMRQYGQLGDYRCPTCGFERADLTFEALDIEIAQDGATFTVASGPAKMPVHMPFTGSYMVYNVLAMITAGLMAGLTPPSIQQAIDEYEPQNGRLQTYNIAGHQVLTNLAKNPVGFNQNIELILQGNGPKAVAFFVNDAEGDGRDVSWLWDVTFEDLANRDDIVVYAGGIRRNDIQVRLKYAGIDAKLVDGGVDALKCAAADAPDAKVFLIANYTALPTVKAELDRLEAEAPTTLQALERPAPPKRAVPTPTGQHLAIAHLFPALLNQFGDDGNVKVLADRAQRRGITVDVEQVNQGDTCDFSKFDIVFIGSGSDRAQNLASKELSAMGDDLRAFVEDDGVMLAVSNGMQLIGTEWYLDDEAIPGLGLVDLKTKPAAKGTHDRLVSDVALRTELASMPVIGYENHTGRTFIGNAATPFGSVVSSIGSGNNETDKVDGIRYRNVFGTYLHGPVLAKNPEIADELLTRALGRQATRKGEQAPKLSELDDTVEQAANAFMSNRLGLR